MCTPAKRAFTLVEILIVVVILGILAGFVIPKFTDASEQAHTSSLLATLRTLRGQIELYRVQNTGADPDLSSDWTDMLVPPNGEDPYMQGPPKNPLMPAANDDTVGAAGTAWIWQPSVLNPSINQIYPWDPIDNDLFDIDDNGIPE